MCVAKHSGCPGPVSPSVADEGRGSSTKITWSATRGWREVQCCFLFHITSSTHGLCSECHWFYYDLMKSLFCFLRQEISTTIPAVHDAADVIKCSQKERKCICKVCKISLICTLAGSIFLLSALFRYCCILYKKKSINFKKIYGDFKKMSAVYQPEHRTFIGSYLLDISVITVRHPT